MNTYRYRPDYWGDDGPDPLRPTAEDLRLVLEQTAD
jgi:hypothetical protein